MRGAWQHLSETLNVKRARENKEASRPFRGEKPGTLFKLRLTMVVFQSKLVARELSVPCLEKQERFFAFVEGRKPSWGSPAKSGGSGRGSSANFARTAIYTFSILCNRTRRKYTWGNTSRARARAVYLRPVTSDQLARAEIDLGVRKQLRRPAHFSR